MDQQQYELEIRRIQSKEPKTLLAELVTDVADFRQRFDLIERKIVAMKAYEDETERMDNAWVESVSGSDKRKALIEETSDWLINTPKVLRLTSEIVDESATCSSCGKTIVKNHKPVSGSVIVYFPEEPNTGKPYCGPCLTSAGKIYVANPANH